jgi:hypothetical protein
VLDDLGFTPEQATALKFKTEMYQAILKYAPKHSQKELTSDSRSSFRWFQADEELRLHETVLDEAAFAIDRKRAGPLQSNDFPVANSKTCVLDFGLRRLLVRLPQFGPKTRFAHSACFAAVALQEVMTAGRTNEVRAGHPKPV